MIKAACKADRTIHVFTGVGILVIGLPLALIFQPALSSDVPTTFSTVTGFATLYGLIFTVVEVVRAKDAASKAEHAAKQAHDAVALLYDIRDGSECLSLIEAALSGIDREGTVQLALLARILKIYSATFCEEQKDDASPHRQNVAMMESYSAFPKPRALDKGKLKSTLMSMTGHLSATASIRVQGGTRK